MRLAGILILSILLLAAAGCGYTSASLLPPDCKSIRVDNFVNAIDTARVVSNRRASYSYWPGLETSITRAVIDDFIRDGNLKIKSEKEADLLLEGTLTNFQQFPLSYSKDETVVEFRMEIMVNIELYDNHTGKPMWKEDSFMGQTNYTISGPNAKTEAAAVADAVRDLAERVVERTVENW